MTATTATLPPPSPSPAEVRRPFSLPLEPVADFPPPHRWTVEEYDRMVARGGFSPDLRVELLEGTIVDKMPNHPPHAYAVATLQDVYATAVSGGRWRLRSQLPLRISAEDSEPEPDLLLLHPARARYANRHPEPADVFLLVEVADSSLVADRKKKLPLYARAGIAEYWIVNVAGRQVEVHRDPDPTAGVYRQVAVFTPGQHVAPAAFPGATLAVGELFGEAGG